MLLIRISKRKNFRIFMCSKHTNEPPFPSGGGGAKSSHRARLRPSKTIKKFSSLEVEKELKITSLLGNVHLSRSNPERILQLKTGVPPCPIIAPTSQVGEVAVVRTPVSYKCGWGSDKTNPHLNLPGVNILVWYVILQAGCIYPWKACACVIQLAHSPRSFGERDTTQRRCA